MEKKEKKAEWIILFAKGYHYLWAYGRHLYFAPKQWPRNDVVIETFDDYDDWAFYVIYKWKVYIAYWNEWLESGKDIVIYDKWR